MSGDLGHRADQAAPPPDELDRQLAERLAALRLGVALPILALAPIYLLAPGAGAGWDAAIFALLLAPLLAFAPARRALSFPALRALGAPLCVALALALSFASGAISWAAIACLGLAAQEGALAASLDPDAPARGGRAAALALAGLALLTAATAAGWLAPPRAFGAAGGAVWAEIAAVAAALIYGGLIGGFVAGVARARARSARAGAAAYAELVESLGDVALQLDRAGVVVDVASDPFLALGVLRSALSGRGLFERILVVDRPAFLKAVAEAADGAEIAIEIRLRRGGDAEAPNFGWTELRLRRCKSADGRVLGLLRDATAMRAALADMARARAEAERANALKNRFVANVSHELRTPLNAIIGFSDLLSQEATAPRDPARARDYAGLIHDSGRHLLDLVNMILDLSKIEAGGFDLACEDFELAGLAALCCDMVRLKAQTKNIALTCSIAPHLGAICADRRAVTQIVLNLLTNAIKFTPEGGAVALSCRPEGAMIEIAVADTGVGVAAQDLARLGAPFFQADGGYDRRCEGAGLGLSIVRGLVGLHGGRLTFASAPGEGSRVAALLPRQNRPALDAKPASIEILPHCAPLRDQNPEFARAQPQVKKIA